MYTVFFCTLAGLARIAKTEISSIIDAPYDSVAELTDSVLSIKTSLQNACLLAYASQTAKSVLLKIGESDEKMEEIVVEDLSPFLGNQSSFALRCLNSENKKETEEKIGSRIKQMTKLRVSLKTPELLFTTIKHNGKIHICIDLAGFELAKRSYRIYIHPETIKAPLAYAATVLCDYKTLLDPFCGSGIIPIEAALNKTHTSPHFYSKERFLFTSFPEVDAEKVFSLRDNKIKKEIEEKIYAFDKNPGFLRSAEKNAILAGVKHNISFSRVDVKDLDLKFEKDAIDLVATQPPSLTKHNRAFIEKIYSEFFYQAEYITSSVCCVTTEGSFELLDKAAKKYKFEVKEKFSVEQKILVLFKKI